MMDMSYFPIFILLFLFSFCKSDDSLTQGKPLYPGNMLVSKGGIFALGFFSPTNSNRGLYVGIWFYNIREPNRTIVWVANRDNSATSTSPATLTISNKSDLVLSDSRGRTLWMTKNNITAEEGANASAILLDTGNLVLSLPNGTIIWQSFDHPTDTIMPGMKFLLSYKDHVVGRLIAWKGPYDPSVGEFSFSLDPSSKMQIVTWHGTKLYCRMKVWNGASVSGGTYPGNTSSVVYQTIVNTGDKFYLMYTVSDGSPYARIMLDYTGTMRLLTWNSHTSSWVATSERPTGGYGVYGSCGTFGYSDFTGAVPTCQCLDGFKSNSLNSSSGCQRVEVLKCGKQNHFVALPRMKVPDKFLRIQNRSFDQCAAECSRNCSCTAYAYANLSSSSTMADQTRCLIWTGELVDTWKVNNYGENLYIRLANPSGAHDKSNLLKIVLSVLTCLLLLMCIALAWRCKYRVKRRKKEIQKKLMLGCLSSSSELVGENLEALFVSFEDIVVATDNFSDSNMLGRGGFGKVYKGVLEGNKEVAIKRLSYGSGQGIEEFRNEVTLIAKLQHRNLVRLFSCCIHEDEKLLVYEYMANKSLDSFLFDDTRKYVLDWLTRFKIIKGVARGLLYLHQDSRLTIIHRDLKASNILLDKDMNPKISDFGMARIFGGNQQQGDTIRVVGTFLCMEIMGRWERKVFGGLIN
ncbi:G-type lectin S-receptor-like serine/threonine-protein kinase B120 isoform X2 [Brachypodium distachyon]|uniref:G-type lectin S-receptor-like serine/threonine-protein kinase B120 isoform X2 n=1 Tax=Brachypodium distachyon TaxID=15368 RepID=UPI000D0CF30F|nr:G-type lectin S-receptor-like serine/threonine-protein kinase B120 isoform X2 [Brachypodium distachyon]|eukprot:XP_024311511.1 G-type lectin S-receptor-like serine/threonine-protein kinase B120 isoform X2 [Brachypodium distachyon]